MTTLSSRPDAGALDAAEVASFRELLAGSTLPSGSDSSADAGRVALLAELESLKNLACAVQAQLTVDLDVSVRARQAADGAPPDQQGRGVAAEVALARGESPHRGQQLVELARRLTGDLPHALAAMRGGALSEYRASVVAAESAALEVEDRRALDAELFGDGPDAEALTWGTRQLGGRARATADRLDASAAERRAEQARAERHVAYRRTRDGMAYLTSVLPAAEAAAAFASLTREANARRAAGDERTAGQLKADLLVSHLVGALPVAGSSEGSVGPVTVPVRVDLILSDTTLFGRGTDPALLVAEGVPATPVPAQTARDLVADALDAEALDGATRAWIRRLYADPGGDLIAMTSVQRFIRGGLADYLRIRDQGYCRTPYCDAPISQHDHVVPVADGGETSARNAQGDCAPCNDAKIAAGWRQSVVDDDVGSSGAETRHTVETTTPGGQRHLSTAPAPPRPDRPSSSDAA